MRHPHVLRLINATRDDLLLSMPVPLSIGFFILAAAATGVIVKQIYDHWEGIRDLATPQWNNIADKMKAEHDINIPRLRECHSPMVVHHSRIIFTTKTNS